MTARSPSDDISDTSASLLKAATDLFAEKGLDGTSVKEIAEAAGVNVSLVSYHFGGKEGIYKACLDQFGKSKIELAARILKAPETAEELRVRLRMLIDEMFTNFIGEPCVHKILLRDVELGNEVSVEIYRTRFFKLFELLRDFMASAAEKGFVRKGIDPSAAVPLLLGMVIHLMRVDTLSEKIMGFTLKDPVYREHMENQLMEIFLKGVGETPGVKE